MNFYTLLRKGESHPVYCEDFAVTYQDETQCVLAVFDGCSSGKESMFASSLLGKIVRKNAHYKTLEGILQHTFEDLQKAKKNLKLHEEELLATVLIALYHKETAECELIAIGDGYLLVNDEITEIDQCNTPDYLAYYLQDDFEYWWSLQKNILKVKNPKRIGVSTDGIGSFKSNQADLPADFNPINYLFFDDQWTNLPTMLYRKANVLDKKHGFLPYDDLGVALLIL